jgi:hypothetical protein
MFFIMLACDILSALFLVGDPRQRLPDDSTCSKRRGRSIKHAIAGEFPAGSIDRAGVQQRLADAYFTVDQTLIGSLASFESFKDGTASRRIPKPAAREWRDSMTWGAT